jgi:hypothetical protein
MIWKQSDLELDNAASSRGRSRSRSSGRSASQLVQSRATLEAWHHLGLANFAIRVAACKIEPRVRWLLAPPPGTTEPQAHIDWVLMEALRDGFEQQCYHFKCGITHKPYERMRDFPDYNWPDRRLYVALVSESSQFIGDQETIAIDRYHKNHNKNWCRNRSRGGAGAHVGNSPFFLYIIVGNAYNWHPDTPAP